MYHLGLDIGSSSIKIALVNASTGKSVGVVTEPETEMSMEAVKNGWAEQSPLDWWRYVCSGIDKLCTQEKIEKS
ncbi:MAG TPA: carbohydrate kinase, partial [Maribacter sp.]|nr:carbohydrate kinase [Maribacter sp.]